MQFPKERSFHNANAIADAITLHCIGEVINMEFVSIKDRIAKEFMAAEAIKMLRTNVIFSVADVKTVGLTSFYESDGKSTISFNLAA